MHHKRKHEADRDDIEQAPWKKNIHQNSNTYMEQLLESAAEVEPLDEIKLKEMLTALGKAIQSNQDLRLKYAHDPTKFMESEIEVDMRIKDLMPLAAYPQLYPVLVAMNIMSPILSLLTHENFDIVIDTVELIRELTDDQVSADEISLEFEKPLHTFVDDLIGNDLISVLQFNLERFDEKQDVESNGVYSILAILENIISLKPAIAIKVSANKKLLEWLLSRINASGFDANKQYASEIIAILLQNSDDNMELADIFVSLNSFEYLLSAISGYNNHDPADADEVEFLENLFDATCSCLRAKKRVLEAFVKNNGIELICSLLKYSKSLAAQRSIKTLSFALASEESPLSVDICRRFVDNSGLKHFFAHLFKKPGKADEYNQEYCIAVLSVLLRDLDDSPPQFRRSRLMSKFNESDFEKLNQTIEMFTKFLYNYNSWSDANESKLKTQYQGVSENEFADIFYIHSIENGLLPLQQLAVIITQLYNGPEIRLKEEINNIFGENSTFKDVIIKLVEEFAGQVDTLADKIRARKLLLALDSDHVQ